MLIHRARWVLPIEAPPIRDGWVAVDGGRIAAVGGPAGTPPAGEQRIHPHSAILPGLVNAHTHLELSWMAGRVPPSDSMGRWIRSLMALRRGAPPSAAEQHRAAADALTSARAAGTVAFGDIGNDVIGADVMADAEVPGVLFHELIGFAAEDPRGAAEAGLARVSAAVRPPVRPGLAPHAPYSVSPDLFLAVDHVASRLRLPSSVHLGESADEVEFLMSGTGGIAATLKHLGAWNDQWSVPHCDPAEYLDRIGVLRPGLLTVHCTQLSTAALSRLAGRGCVIVTCPRSNRWVGAGDPPVTDFYASGAPVAVGTDSLASVDDLNLFAELAVMRQLAPSVPASRLLDSATRAGAEALGFGTTLGTIAAGKDAALIAVDTPADLRVAGDVEEYLLSGIQPAQVQLLNSEP